MCNSWEPRERLDQVSAGYKVLFTPDGSTVNGHTHNRPDITTVAEFTIVKCGCGQMFRAEAVYNPYACHLEWADYEGCPFTQSHTKQWCGYDECREH